MTDVTVAPPSAAPSSPSSPPSPPPANEVVIDQNRTDAPSPIGSQAPPTLEGQRPVHSARDSILKAFERANNPPPKGAKIAEKATPPAAEARAGHNQPPEATEKIDLKKRPSDQPRGDRGQFAPRVNGEVRSNAANVGQDPQIISGVGHAQDAQLTDGEYKRLPPHAPFAEPPQRISERARRDWADTPETVRGDIHRMHHEFNQAYQAYRGAAEAFEPIAPYHQLAQECGTTLQQALSNYTSIEQKLREDPVAALDTIVNNLGLIDPETQQRIGLRDIAYHVLSQSPEQLRQVQQGNQQTAAKHQIGALYQKVERLENEQQQMHAERQFYYTRSQIDQFADDDRHPRFDELGGLIEEELKLGFDLETAYRRAELLQPATHAAQTRTTPAQTRTYDRSIHGSPDVAPSNGASRRPREPSPTARDAIQNALKRYSAH